MARYSPQQSNQLALEALELIKKCVAERGYPPSTIEIQGHLKLGSRAGAMRLLDRLQRDGLIERVKGQSRAIRVIDMKARTTPL